MQLSEVYNGLLYTVGYDHRNDEVLEIIDVVDANTHELVQCDTTVEEINEAVNWHSVYMENKTVALENV